MPPYPSKLQKGVRSLRRGRFSGLNQIYHVATATEKREKLFADFGQGRMVVDSIRYETESGRCDTLCFVLMPDHLHWLLQLKANGSLASSVNNVKAHSAWRINSRYRRKGKVWQKGFYDRAMRRDEDVVATARYIIANPVRAGIVGQVGDYPLWDAIWV
jgi:REP element-mobilizing transposase RayT